MLVRARFIVPCLALVACGGDPGGGAGGACEANPEPAAHVQGIWTNGIWENGLWENGITEQGTSYQGVNMQGVSLNGMSTQGEQLNGTSLNGENLNGESLNGVSVEGASPNELVAKLADGRVLSGDAFVGAMIPAVLSDGTSIALRIAAFERDADVAYYRLEHDGANVCAGDDKGMFVPGVWDKTGSRYDALTVGGQRITASFACSAGVLNKCVRWGYAPWKVGADLHQACTRMARADYCGNGVSFTKNGTLIDIFDTRGIQSPTADASLLFEAGWGPDGAVCVNRTRYDARTPAGQPALPSCWATLPKCSSFADAEWRGATLGNASRVQSRTFCGQ
jgi:hypothetical protein